jgi:hypothetical protein
MWNIYGQEMMGDISVGNGMKIAGTSTILYSHFTGVFTGGNGTTADAINITGAGVGQSSFEFDARASGGHGFYENATTFSLNTMHIRGTYANNIGATGGLNDIILTNPQYVEISGGDLIGSGGGAMNAALELGPASAHVTVTGLLTAGYANYGLVIDNGATDITVVGGTYSNGAGYIQNNSSVSALSVTGTKIPWFSYTPTISVTGSFTSATATGKYLLSGKSLSLQMKLVETNATGASGSLGLSLPTGLTAANDHVLVGREVVATGVPEFGTVNATASTVNISNTANSAPITTGYTVVVNGIIEVQ